MAVAGRDYYYNKAVHDVDFMLHHTTCATHLQYGRGQYWLKQTFIPLNRRKPTFTDIGSEPIPLA